MGMVGGGGEAFIGAIHQMAAQLDGKIGLIAGAFSSNAERSKRSGETLGLHPSRVYGDYRTMVIEEAKLPAGERIRPGYSKRAKNHRRVAAGVHQGR